MLRSQQIITRDDKSEENANKMFNFLQIIGSCFVSFVYGGNYVCNAVVELAYYELINNNSCECTMCELKKITMIVNLLSKLKSISQIKDVKSR